MAGFPDRHLFPKSHGPSGLSVCHQKKNDLGDGRRVSLLRLAAGPSRHIGPYFAAPPCSRIPHRGLSPLGDAGQRHSQDRVHSRSVCNMMRADVEESGLRVHLRARGREREFVVPQARLDQLQRMATAIARAPFTRRTWRELLFFVLAGLLGAVGVAFIGLTMAAGTVLAVTFVGLVVVRGVAARRAGHRRVASWARPQPA